MGLFNNLGTQELEKSEDRLGGFKAIDTDIYTGPVKALFAGKSKEGAMSLTVVVDIGGGREYKETLWITNKKGENFFTKDNKKQPLPGFTVANEIALMTTEKELHQLDTEEKVIKLYDFELKKEVPTTVQMVTEAIGKPVALGILKVLENKSKKNDSTGKYEPIEETREVNIIDKVFHPELHVTIPEARDQKPAEFWDGWLKRNKGQLRDKRDIKDGDAGAKSGGKGGSSGPPQAGGGGQPPKKSLFGK